jgi:UDP-glucose 4-epimerase
MYNFSISTAKLFMKVVITGGAGFIGSHLADFLIDSGNEVVVIDNLSIGRLENIAHHLDNTNFKFLQADIVDYDSIESTFKDAEWVFHLAALADIVPSIENPTEYFKSNVNGTFNVLQASRKYNIKKIIYTASSSCYGIPDEYPTNEMAEIRPQYPYALTKNLGEQLVMHWCELYNLPAISLRFFNVYGPRARTSGTYGAVFGVFLAQKIANKPFTVVGDGCQTRDFTYVSDIVSALIAAASNNVSGEIINIGSNATYSINRLVELLEGDVIFIPKRPGEPESTWADISKATNLLDWSPLVGLEDGVKILLNNLDYWNDAPLWDRKSIEKATEKWFEYLDK